MATKESKKLQLIFKNSAGGQNTLSPKHFREDVTEPELKTWMDDLSELELFHHAEKDVDLYAEKKAARMIETKVTDIFDVDDTETPEA